MEEKLCCIPRQGTASVQSVFLQLGRNTTIVPSWHIVMVPLCRWTGSSELLESLLSCLHTPTACDTPPDTPPLPPEATPTPATTSPPLTAPLAPTPAGPNRTISAQWGVYKTQRLALLVIATLLQQQQRHCELMMRLVQTRQRNSDGGLCQCLLELASSVTRDDSGREQNWLTQCA